MPASGQTQAIYVTAALKGVISRDPLVAGDVILAVNGKPLGPDSTGQFKKPVAAANDGPGFLWVSRWRNARSSRA